ncbi:MAG: transposase [Myxococcota bacterium]|nr:transposase [Myxococcota bacterium]
MAKPRKRHVQQALVFKKRGGKRPGAGRKPKGKRSSAPHKKRPELKPYQPVHVVMRVHADIGSLRKRLMYAALREATITAARRERVEHEKGRFRIVHISIQRTHVHMLVEADHKAALSLGMQSFQISAAKHLNRAVSVKLGARRRGSVFPDRYHQEIIKTPRQARHTLAYVLNNWRKHREDQSPLTRKWNVDAFSTGPLFTGWTEREGEELLWRWRETYRPLIVYLPSTWLLKVGWRKKGGGTIPFRYVPSEPFGGPAGMAVRVRVHARSGGAHVERRRAASSGVERRLAV